MSYNTSLHIALSIKQIGLAINHIRSGGGYFWRGILIVAGTVPIASTFTASYPSTFRYTTVVKVKSDTVACIFVTVESGKRCRIEIIPFTVNLDPTTVKLTANGIVVYTVNGLKSCRGRFSAAIASNLITDDRKSMTGSGNCSTPFHNGVTAFAEGSASITVFNTGRSLIGKCYGSMNMGRTVIYEIDLIHVRHGGIHFGIYLEFFVGEGARGAVGKGDQTLINVHLHVLSPELIGGPIGFCGIAGNLDIRIEVKNTNGKLCENRLATVVVRAITGNGNGCGIGFFVDSIGCGEAFCKLHMIELPMVNVVQVDHSFNLLNGFDSGCFEVHPVDRTEINSVEVRICGNERKSRIGRAGFHLDHTDDNRLVACVVADLEFYAVVAVRKLDILR